MPDTIRSKSAILALLPDNTAGDISPQDLRDAIVTVHGVYGQVYVHDGASAQSLTTTAAKLTGFAANGVGSAGTTPDHTNDQITVGTDGVYLVWWTASFTAQNTHVYQFHIRVDGTEQVASGGQITGTGGSQTTSTVTLLSLTASQVLTVYGESDQGGGSNWTPVHMQLMTYRVA